MSSFTPIVLFETKSYRIVQVKDYWPNWNGVFFRMEVSFHKDATGNKSWEEFACDSSLILELGHYYWCMQEDSRKEYLRK